MKTLYGVCNYIVFIFHVRINCDVLGPGIAYTIDPVYEAEVRDYLGTPVALLSSEYDAPCVI